MHTLHTVCVCVWTCISHSHTHTSQQHGTALTTRVLSSSSSQCSLFSFDTQVNNYSFTQLLCVTPPPVPQKDLEFGLIQRVHENQKHFVLLSYMVIYQCWNENFGTLQVWREQYVQLIGGKNKSSKPIVFCTQQISGV